MTAASSQISHRDQPAVVVIEPHPAQRLQLVEALGSGVHAVASPAEMPAAAIRTPGSSLPARPVVVVVGPSLDPVAVTVFTHEASAGKRHEAKLPVAVVGVSPKLTNAEVHRALIGGVGDLVPLDGRGSLLRHAVRRCGLQLMVDSAVSSPHAPPPPHASDSDSGDGSDSDGDGEGDGEQVWTNVGSESPSVSLPDRTIGPAEPTAGQPVAPVAGGVVVVMAPKGGAGGSTVAANVAVALAQGAATAGRPPWQPGAVVIDADLQFGDQALLLGIEPRTSLASMAAADGGARRQVTAAETLDATLATNLLDADQRSGVAVLAAPVDPALADTIDPALLLRAVDVLGGVAPWTVVDLPSRLDDLALGLIDRCNHLVLVMTPDLASLKATRTTTDVLRRLGIDGSRWSVVCNNAGHREGLATRDVVRHLEVENLHVVPHDTAVAAAPAHGVPLMVSHPTAPAAAAIGDLAASLAGEVVVMPDSGTGPWALRGVPAGVRW